MLTKIGKIVGWTLLMCLIGFVGYTVFKPNVSPRQLVWILNEDVFHHENGLDASRTFYVDLATIRDINKNQKTVELLTKTSLLDHGQCCNKHGERVFKEPLQLYREVNWMIYTIKVDCSKEIYSTVQIVEFDAMKNKFTSHKTDPYHWQFFNLAEEKNKKEYKVICK